MQPPADPTIAEIAPWSQRYGGQTGALTAAELAQLPDEPGFELIEGSVVQMPPLGAEHGAVAFEIGRVLGNHVKPRGLGVVFAAETGFQIASHPDTVLAADMAFVRTERIPPRRSRPGSGYWQLAPDLVVEVVSPGQHRRGMLAKARRWLAAGSQLVWIVWPKTRQIDVWQVGDAQPGATLGPDDTLDGGAVVPGFAVRVGELF